MKISPGEIIAFSTDTVYGVGCLLYDNLALERIYVLKNRERGKKLPVLCYNVNQIKEIAYVTEKALELIRNQMPGPLTIVLNATEQYFSKTLEKTVAVRIPNSVKLLSLLENFGALWATSLNETGFAPIETHDEAQERYKNAVDRIYFDEDVFMSNEASTIVDLTSDSLKILRQGKLIIE